MHKQQGILLIMPAIIVMGLFTAYPLFEGLRIAFTNTHLLKEGAGYIGFQNFIRLLTDEIFWLSLYHSVLLTAVVVFLQFVLGLILALAMNQKLPGMSLFKSIIMASWVIPVAATVILFKFMAQPDIGLINIVIRSLGFEVGRRPAMQPLSVGIVRITEAGRGRESSMARLEFVSGEVKERGERFFLSGQV